MMKHRNFLSFALAFLLPLAAGAVTPNKVWRIPGSGSVGSWGAINLGSANAVSGILGKGYGGLGIDASSLTIPSTGTLATLAGAETFTNKTLTSPIIGSFFDLQENNSVLASPSSGNRRLQVFTDGTLVSTNSSGVAKVIGPVVPVIAEAASPTATFTTSSTSYVDVTDATVTATVATGRPLFVYLYSQASGYLGCQTATAACNVTFQFLAGATVVGECAITDNITGMTAGTINVPVSSCMGFQANPTGGVTTFKLQAKASSPNTARVNSARVVVFQP